MDDPPVVAELRERFAIRNLAPAREEDPDDIALLEAMERREEAERRLEFGELVTELRSRWPLLRVSSALTSFRTMRDKLIAHHQLWHDGDKYRPLDVASLGLKRGDLRAVRSELQTLVDLTTLVFRQRLLGSKHCISS